MVETDRYSFTQTIFMSSYIDIFGKDIVLYA